MTVRRADRRNRDMRSGNLGEELRRLRGQRSLRDIAGALGMSHTTYQRLEENDAAPTMAELVQICGYYRITPDELFTLAGLWELPEHIDKHQVDEIRWSILYANAQRLNPKQRKLFYEMLDMLLASLSDQLPKPEEYEGVMPAWLRERRDVAD